MDAYVRAIFNSLPATDKRLLQIQAAQEEDPTCILLKRYCLEGWPSKQKLKGEISKYLHTASELSICEGLILRNSRIVVPKALQKDILQKLHSGHQGINKCKRRAAQSVWWPGLNKDLDTMVSNCSTCCKMQFQLAEPLIPTPLITLPWQKVGVDLFKYKKSSYIIMIDYFSRFIEIAKLTSTSSTAVITHMKSIFARHGIPYCVMSDNGPQFSADTFSSFAKQYGFIHYTNSPRYPQANGEVERGVRTVETLLKKAEENLVDPYLALLAYRNTPLSCGYSPAQLTMCRTLRSTLPSTIERLKPKLPDIIVFQEREEKIKLKMKSDFDTRNRAQTLPVLNTGDIVWLPNENTEASVMEKVGPRAYTVVIPKGILQSNRSQIRVMPQMELTEDNLNTSSSDKNNEEDSLKSDQKEDATNPYEEPKSNPDSSPIAAKSNEKVISSGRISRPPKRFGEHF